MIKLMGPVAGYGNSKVILLSLKKPHCQLLFSTANQILYHTVINSTKLNRYLKSFYNSGRIMYAWAVTFLTLISFIYYLFSRCSCI